jgi:hypothetical protein
MATVFMAAAKPTARGRGFSRGSRLVVSIDGQRRFAVSARSHGQQTNRGRRGGQLSCRCSSSVTRKGKGEKVRLVKPEVLAPVGGWDQLKAAVAHGADAVYFGINDGFNARARAHNFDMSEVKDVMKFLNEYGVKGFACLNVLVFEEEVERVTRSLLALERAKVDAVIVQDNGVMALAKQVAPSLKIHASTQASVSSLQGSVYTARNLGVERVVVGRELSIKEIAKIDQGLRERVLESNHAEKEDSFSNPSLEVFVHGALCVRQVNKNKNHICQISEIVVSVMRVQRKCANRRHGLFLSVFFLCLIVILVNASLPRPGEAALQTVVNAHRLAGCPTV